MHGARRRAAVAVRSVRRASRYSAATLARRAAVAMSTMIYANYIVFRILVFIFGFFHGRFAVLSTNFPRTFHGVPKNRHTLRNTYALRGILGRWYGDISLNSARYSRDLPLHGKHANLLRASLRFFDGLAKFGNYSIAAENRRCAYFLYLFLSPGSPDSARTGI